MPKKTQSEPDFSYPQTVLEEAKEQITASTKESGAEAGLDRLNGLLKGLAAMQAIDPDNIKEQLQFLHDNADTATLSAADRALVLAMEAQLLRNYAQQNSWSISSREVPGAEDDVTLWNEEQFKNAIDKLYARATELAANVDVAPYINKVLAGGDKEIFFSLGSIFHAWSDSNEKFSDHCKVGTPAFFYWTALEAGNLTAKQWMAEYEKYKEYEWSNYLLCQIFINYLCPLQYQSERTQSELRDTIIAVTEEAIKEHKNFPYNDYLEERIVQATTPYFSVKTDEYIPVGAPAKITIEYYNLKKLELDICPLATNKPSQRVRKELPAQSTITFEPDSIEGEVTLDFTVSKPGYYLIRALHPENKSVLSAVVEAVPFIPVVLSNSPVTLAITTDFATGKPLKDVKVSLKDSLFSSFGSTNDEGLLWISRLSENNRRNDLSFNYQGRDYTFDNDFRLITTNPNTRKATKEYSVNILSDRAIYHRGETVEWVAIVGHKDIDGKKSVVQNASIEVSLKNTNRKEVASTTVTTDEHGRATGSFQIPSDGLTGTFQLQANCNSYGATEFIMVSDFKAPVMEVKITKVSESPTEVFFEGVATTMSGMPVVDGEVAVSVRRAYFGNDNSVTTDSLKRTDANGAFTFSVKRIKKEDFEEDEDYFGNNYTAEVTITDRAGATANVSQQFKFRKPYALSISPDEGKISTEKPFTFTVKANDVNNTTMPLELKWLLRKGNETVMSGEGVAGSAISVDAEHLAAGEYTLAIEPLDRNLANTVTSDDYIFYNIKKNLVPDDEVIFLPEDRLKIDENERSFEVTIGTAQKKAWVYFVSTNGAGLQNVQLEELKSGFKKVRLPLSGSGREEITVVSQIDGDVCYETINVERKSQAKIGIEVESLRDKTIPGNHETWRLRVIGSGAEGSAAIATMYDKALEQLYRHHNSLYFYFHRPYFNETQVSKLYFSHPSFTLYFNGNNKLRVPSFNTPQFLYLPNFYGGRRRLYSNANLNYVPGLKIQDATDGDEDAEYEISEEVLSAEPAIYGARAASDLSAAVTESKATEAKVEEFREPEVLQAFWMPRLVADDEGVVTIEFTVPNANTTWAFKMFSYTSDLLTANFDAEVLASKPVMVQSAVPRYLRQGDSAVLRATVYNNTDSAATVSAVFEVFDPATGKTITTTATALNLEAKGSGIVTVPVEAGVNMASVGYRIKGTGNGYSDGEQGILPILASSQMVVESQEFYLDAKGEGVTLTAPEANDARTTLQYCQNPIWTVVKALRSINWYDNSLATCAANNLSTAAVTMHILQSNPRLESVIKTWKSNPDSKALTSMLEQNSELKTLLLDQTPWVMAAESNTDRMNVLVNALDSARCEDVIRRAVAALNKVQTPEGGFRWAAWSDREPSLWVTLMILQEFGVTNTLGALPKEIMPISLKALRWLETKAVEDPKAQWLHDQYAFVASMFTDFTPTVEGSRLIKGACRRAAGHWKGMDLSDKAYTAMMLDYYGYKDVARSIIRSIEQFGKVRPGRGMEFPSVRDMRAYGNIIQAVAKITPDNPILDPMRQWVILQAQATDDLGAWNPNYVIYSVLFTGTPWQNMTSVQPIKLNGQQMMFPEAELATGYFTRQIEPGTVVSVEPTGVTPSYGSLVSIFTAPMTEVKAVAGTDVSISKRMMVKRAGEWVETTAFIHGEEIQVQLQIVVGRQMEYVAITDERPAGFEPVDQLPGWMWSNGIGFYRENRDSSTNLFIGYLPKGSYSLTYSMTAATEGTYASGLATFQSQYDPALTAHSAGTMIKISR